MFPAARMVDSTGKLPLMIECLSPAHVLQKDRSLKYKRCLCNSVRWNMRQGYLKNHAHKQRPDRLISQPSAKRLYFWNMFMDIFYQYSIEVLLFPITQIADCTPACNADFHDWECTRKIPMAFDYNIKCTCFITDSTITEIRIQTFVVQPSLVACTYRWYRWTPAKSQDVARQF